MALEIERRYILKNMPKGKQANSLLEIKQYYLSSKNDTTTERVRETYINELHPKYVYTHTIKSPHSEMAANEDECEITEEKFNEFRKKSRRKLTKDRSVYEHDGLKFEVDKFDHIHLIIMEVELPSEDYDFEIPGFIQDEIICEITGKKEFSNSNLAS